MAQRHCHAVSTIQANSGIKHFRIHMAQRHCHACVMTQLLMIFFTSIKIQVLAHNKNFSLQLFFNLHIYCKLEVTHYWM